MTQQPKQQLLKKYRLFDEDVIGMFDGITAIAKETCNTPYAMVSFIDDNTQWIMSTHSPFPTKLDFRKSFCEMTLKNKVLFEVQDTLLNKQTSENQYVLQAPFIRFYTGIPITNADGIDLGTLSVLDTQPNALSSEQKSILKLLAKDILSQLELRKKNIELVKLKELHHLITENNQDLIFAKDSDFKILHANSAFISLYPKEMRDRVIGYTTIEGYNEQEAKAFTAQDRLAFELGKTETIEKIKFPSGETRTLFTTKTRFEDEAGEAYILGVARDVTEREDLIAKLEKSNADLDEFAYIASHDLKSPLNAIKRLVSWIEEDSKEILIGESLEHFGMIKNRIDRMNSLLKDLLNYSRIGKNDGAPQKLNLKETAQDCFDLLDLPQDFVIEVDNKEVILPKLPLELVLTNLMSNAIKHHDKQTGQVNIQLEELRNEYKLTVSDDGPGIAPSFHSKIFQKFQTLKPRDEVEGSGLGLAMIEKALNNYSGKISVQSDVGKGTTFIIIWPKQQSAEK